MNTYLNFFTFVGLCPECSVKLNYRFQKKEVHKKKKELKRLGTAPRKLETQSNASSSTENPEITVKIEPEEDDNKESSGNNASEIWKGNVSESVEKSREEEFEEYLADLLL